MTKLVMLPILGLATASGGLVGSNYVFSKTVLQDLNQGSEKWDEKLDKLLTIVTTDSDLKGKINKGGNVDNLEIVKTTGAIPNLLNLKNKQKRI